jgi:uncharacterized membrane protein
MRFFRHIRLSRPSWQEAVIAMLGWGAVVPLCIVGDYLLWRHMLPLGLTRLTFIFGLGGALAAPIALWCAKIIARKNANSAFAAMFMILSTSTIGLTAMIFAIDFWSYFSQWHGEVFSRLWVIQFVFTFGSAIYQFMVSGLRLYLPLGLVALILASMWASHRITR